MYISKNQIVRRIRRAARSYREHLVGRTFMFVYDDKYIEVMFKTTCFYHLTGVGSNLSAADFYKHAVKGNDLKPSEISFDTDHPFDLVDLKTTHLKDLYKITIQDVFIADDIITATALYKVGITNLELTLCLGRDTDKEGNVINDRWIPYSFRVENIKNENFDSLYEVTHVFVKESNASKSAKYCDLTFGDTGKLAELPENIIGKIDL